MITSSRKLDAGCLNNKKTSANLALNKMIYCSGMVAPQVHKGGVTCGSLSPSGKLLVTSSDDGTLQLWSLPYGEHIGSLLGHTAKVSWCTFSRDGDTIVSCSHDKTVKVWSADTLECTDTKIGHVGPVRVCAISPDGFQIASCGTNIKLWSTHFSECLGTLKDHVGAVNTAAFNPDGTLIASGGDDKDVRVWEAMVGDEPPPEYPMKRLVAHKTPVTAVAFSPDGVGLCSCAMSGNVRLWVWASDECLFSLASAHATGVNNICFSTDGLRVATAAVSGRIKVWSANGFEQLSEFDPAHGDETTCVGFSANNHVVDGNLVPVPQGERQPVITADPVEVIISTSADGTIRFWDNSAAMEEYRLNKLIAAHEEAREKQAARHAAKKEERRLQRLQDAEDRKGRLAEEMAIQAQHIAQQQHRDSLERARAGGPPVAGNKPSPRRSKIEEDAPSDSCRTS